MCTLSQVLHPSKSPSTDYMLQHCKETYSGSMCNCNALYYATKIHRQGHFYVLFKSTVYCDYIARDNHSCDPTSQQHMMHCTSAQAGSDLRFEIPKYALSAHVQIILRKGTFHLTCILSIQSSAQRSAIFVHHSNS